MSRIAFARALGFFSLAATTLAAGSARAQEPPPAAVAAPVAPAQRQYTRQTYPASLVDRPLVLPKWVFQPTVDVGISNSKAGTGESFGIGFDVGVARKLQIGAMFELPVGPAADFGLLAFNLQTPLGRSANLRFDVGVQRGSFHLDDDSIHTDGFVMGVGLPIKVKLHRMLAFISGSTAARGFAGGPVIAGDSDRKQMTYGVFAPLGNDLFSLAVLPGSHETGALVNETLVTGTMFLPMGLLVQPHDRISFAVRTGYRLTFAHADGGGSDYIGHYVPLAFDVVVNPIRQLDIGFTALIQGYVGDNIAHSAGTTPAPGWADQRQFNIWIGGRI